jgi:hypothetical protein
VTDKVHLALVKTSHSVAAQIHEALHARGLAKDDAGQTATDNAAAIAFGLDLSTMDVIASDIPTDLAGVLSLNLWLRLASQIAATL